MKSSLHSWFMGENANVAVKKIGMMSSKELRCYLIDSKIVFKNVLCLAIIGSFLLLVLVL